MAIVWDHYPKGGSEKLTLLALADWCNDKGESLHPSIAAVAAKVCTSDRQAQRIMNGFIDQGVLEVVGNPTGGAHGSTRQYRLRLDRIRQMRPETGDMDVTPDRGRTGDASVTPTGDMDVTPTGDTGDAGRETPVTLTGDTHVTQTTIEPPKEPPEEEESARARAHPRPPDVPADVWSAWLQVRRAKRAGPVTAIAMAAIEREARKAGLTVAEALTVCGEESWRGFRADWYANLRARSTGAARADSGPYEGKYGRTLAGLTGGRMGLRQPGYGGLDAPADAEPVRLPFDRD